MVREEEMTSLCCWRRSIWGSETRSLRKSGEKGINRVFVHQQCSMASAPWTTWERSPYPLLFPLAHYASRPIGSGQALAQFAGTGAFGPGSLRVGPLWPLFAFKIYSSMFILYIKCLYTLFFSLKYPYHFIDLGLLIILFN